MQIPTIAVLPQIAPLEDSEVVLGSGYVRKCLDTHLASRHFRNQIRYYYDKFDRFCQTVHDTWPDIAISDFDSPTAGHGDRLNLFIREADFVAEIASFGHGLQMWLQIVWFITRLDHSSIVILDEPDVYMHPTLQQRLVRMLIGRFCQCILSTHATTIIDCVPLESLLTLDRTLSRSHFNGEGPA